MKTNHKKRLIIHSLYLRAMYFQFKYIRVITITKIYIVFIETNHKLENKKNSGSLEDRLWNRKYMINYLLFRLIAGNNLGFNRRFVLSRWIISWGIVNWRW